jgi:hypothetical protein
MLSVTHAATGAFIAQQLPYPEIYLPLTLFSHYLQDWIPHWDMGTGLSNGSRKISTAFWLEWLDLAMAGVLIYLVWQAGQTQLQLHVWLAALVSLIPDFLEAPKNFLRWQPAFLKPLNKLHHYFHGSIPHMWLGLAPQLATLILIGWLS